MHDLTLESCFHEALQREVGPDRSAFLSLVADRAPDLAVQLRGLLELESEESAFLAEGTQVLPRWSPDLQEGTVVQRYRVLERIGQGGNADVYRAEDRQAELPDVALKVLRCRPDADRVLARFEGEHQALARMEHPGIAHIRDVGTLPDGRPFFAMELVAGVPITEYADEQTLSVAARLGLLRDLCQAVQHAHQKGIVHRDLKPSNVLVVEVDGVPRIKVIDFGLAKASTAVVDDPGLTMEGSFMGTPQYMSPEQAGLSGKDIDTRADVYALGVLFYELLTGSTPLQAESLRDLSLLEVQREVDAAGFPLASERAARSPHLANLAAQRGLRAAQLIQALERELDWIAARALAREREERYSTVAELGDDIGRYLAGEPIQARPLSRRYLLHKFVARHRTAALSAALISFVFVLGSLGTAWGWLRAHQAREDLAKAQADTESVAEFQAQRMRQVEPLEMGRFVRAWLIEHAAGTELQGVLEAALSEADFTSLARETTEHSILGPSLRAIEERYGDRPAVEARLLRDLGEARAALGLLDLAAAPLEQALELDRENWGEAHPRTQLARNAVANLHRKRGEYAEARALRDQDEARPATPQQTVTVRVLDGNIAMAEARFDEAEHYYQEARELAEAYSDPGQAISALHNEGCLAQERGEFAKAEAIFRQTLERLSAAGLSGTSDEYAISANLASVCAFQERWEGTYELARHAHEGMSRLHGSDHPLALMTQEALTIVLHGEGRLDEALEVAQEAFRSLEQSLGMQHERTILQAANSARLLHLVGRVQSAEELGRIALEAAQQHLPATSWLRGGISVDYGRILGSLERFPEAENVMIDGYEHMSALLPSAHLQVVEAERSLVRLYGLWDEAEPGQGYAEAAAYWRDLRQGDLR